MGQPLTDALRAEIKASLTAPRKPTHRSKHRKIIAGGGPKRLNLPSMKHLNDGIGCAPEDIDANRDFFRQHGIYVDFTPEGEAIIESQKQLNAMGNACGMRNGAQGWMGGTGREQAQGQQEVREFLEREFEGV